MKLADLTVEQFQEMAMIDLASEILEEHGEPINFFELVKKIGEYKQLPEEEVKRRLAQFYTELNIDGRFLSKGDGRWGLKEWFPVEQMEEEITATIRKKRRAAIREEEEEFNYEEEEELELEDLEEEDFEEIEEDELLDLDDDFDDVEDVEEEEEEFDYNEEEDEEEA
ncbi:DNA-directed RNA polymerase subunit delta [Massilibacterium senegalense]|uniref:DNA-directed RNA polymerase subunit delta n=1 Tax=Massilibacterium senegalense TaxID=1632858 RepID=UPI000782906A|nr:DNA-directed RNA polymerase subunit delta [Massilibacterium senegalense]